ncbi:MAG: thioredoxin family protein, partial [Pedobacter sp.]
YLCGVASATGAAAELVGAPLKAVSAFLPPQDTQDFDLYTPSLLGAPTSSAAAPVADATPHKYAELFHAPLGLPAFFDYDEGMAYAQKMGKPVLIDFTGHACVNCRKMEANVWPDKQVLPLIRDKYVLIQLYVDDKTELPTAEQHVSTYSGKNIKTIYMSPAISNNEPETLAIHYLEDNGNLVIRQRNYNVHFRDGGNLVSLNTVVQLIANDNGMIVTDTTTSYQSIIEFMKLNKAIFPDRLIKEVNNLEIMNVISIEIAPFRPSKPSVKLFNQSYINSNYPAFVKLVADIDKIESKDLSIYLSGLLGLSIT